jgi:hypothetical protein
LTAPDAEAIVLPESFDTFGSAKVLIEEEKSKMQVERTNSNDLLVDKLPDGSKVIVDPKNETVFALNPAAGAAWDACSGPTTLSKVAEDMQRSLDPRITEELALEAILQLQEKKLVTTSGAASAGTRRAMLATLSGIALPLVVSLTIAEQRAHAQVAGSGTHITTTPPPTTTAGIR